GIRDFHVTGVQTCALPIFIPRELTADESRRSASFGERGAAGFGASGGEAVRMRRREASGSGMGTAEGGPPRPVGDGVAASPPARSEERRVGEEGGWRRCAR